MREITKRVDELIDLIVKIPGDKIVTLVADADQSFAIDVSDKGVFGYAKEHVLLFRAKLFSAFNESGSLVVRQFLPIKVERVLANGQKQWIPRKNIYGVQIIDGQWISVPKAVLKQAHCTDSRTGKSLEPELDVTFRDFPLPQKNPKTNK